ncbi:tandem-95 repeat protein, partial [candidate division KSB1 bacterium]|nr:tandem-95 repeat protein [candidate division KSB1 bacterium]
IGNTQSSLDIFALISKSSLLTFSDSSFSLPLFSSKIVTVSFSPPVEGTFTDTLEIHSDDAQLPVIAIPVRGTGILPEGEYWATGLHFGQVIRGGGVDSLRIPLVNTGALPLLIVSITHKAPGLSAVFSLSNTTEDIKPGDSSNVFISFLPSSDTLFLDTIVVLTDGKNITTQEIIISGDAISPRIEVSTDSIDLGIVDIPDSESKLFTISNTNNALLIIDSIVTAGVVFSATVESDSIFPGESKIVTAVFSPDSNIVFLDSISIYSTDPENPLTLVYITGSGKAPLLQITKTLLSFDSVAVGDSLVISGTLFNSGNDTLVISSFSVSGLAFKITLISNSIVIPGDSVFYRVVFLPDTNKTYNETITVSTNDPLNPTQAVNLAGVGTGPEISVSSASLSFADTQIGDTLSLPLTVFNTGKESLTVNSVSKLTASYSVSPVSGVAAVNDSLTLTILFIPQLNRKNLDTLTISSNALSNPVLRVPLAGNNLPPVITSLPDTIKNEGDVFTYTVTANDSDSNVLTFGLLSPPNPPSGMVINSQTGLIAWTIGLVDSGAHSILVEVQDEKAAADTQAFSIVVSSVFNSPVFTSFPDTIIHVDSLFTYQLTNTSEAGPLTFKLLVYPLLPTLMTLSDSTINWLPQETGFFNIVVQAADTLGKTSRQSFTIQVTPDLAPVFSVLPDSVIFEDSSYVGKITAIDHESDSLVYRITEGPGGLVIDPETGDLTWTPDNNDVGTVKVTFSATDTKNNTTGISVNYTVLNTNDPPVISGINNTTVNQDDIVSLQFSIDDPDVGDTLTITDNTSLFDADTTGFLIFKPGNSDVGVNDILIIVSDGLAEDSLNFSLTVLNINDPPEFQDIPDISISTGVLLDLILLAVDIDGDTLVFSLLSGHTGAALNAGTGRFTWTPHDSLEGVRPFQFAVSDPFGLSDTLDLTIVVTKSKKPPVAFSIPQISFNEDEQLNLNIAQVAFDPDNDIGDLTWSITGGDTIQVEFTDTTALFTAPENWNGSRTFTIIITDPAGLSDTLITQIVVLPVNDPPVLLSVSPGADTTIRANDNVLFEYSATDIDNDSLETTWILEGNQVSRNRTYSFFADPAYLDSKNPVKLRLKIDDGQEFSTFEWSIAIDVITSVRVTEFTGLFVPYRGVELYWTTAAGINTSTSFEIQRENENGIRETVFNSIAPSGKEESENRFYFFDPSLPEKPVRYYLTVQQADGIKEVYGPVTVNPEIPGQFELPPAFPNPFNQTVTIPFSLPVHTDVELSIYSIDGRRVKKLKTGNAKAGYHVVRWNGTNESGISVATGMYIVTMLTDKVFISRKVLLIR